MEEITITCAETGTERNARPAKDGSPKMPRGWKRHPKTEAIFSPEGWRRKYKLRAITFPVAGIVTDEPKEEAWKQLREELATLWGQATNLANWATSELYARDVQRMPGMDKMPPQERIYLYPEARERFPDLPSQSTAALLQQVQRKYAAKRFAVKWLASESLPNYKYPIPLPIPSQGWRADTINDGQCPVIHARLLTQRWCLRLQGGKPFYRMRKAFDQIVSGEAIPAEMAVYRKRAHASHRPGMTVRDSGGDRVTTRLMVKLVAWIPKEESVTGDHTLIVRSTPEAMLCATMDGHEEPCWQWHADHVPRWSLEHRRRLQRLSNDQKAEQRPVAAFQSRREAEVQKYHKRMDTAAHTASMQVVHYAARRRCARIIMDDRDHSWCEGFPWHQLLTLIEYKASERGIRFERLGGDESP